MCGDGYRNEKHFLTVSEKRPLSEEKRPSSFSVCAVTLMSHGNVLFDKCAHCGAPNRVVPLPFAGVLKNIVPIFLKRALPLFRHLGIRLIFGDGSPFLKPIVKLETFSSSLSRFTFSSWWRTKNSSCCHRSFPRRGGDERVCPKFRNTLVELTRSNDV